MSRLNEADRPTSPEKKRRNPFLSAVLVEANSLGKRINPNITSIDLSQLNSPIRHVSQMLHYSNKSGLEDGRIVYIDRDQGEQLIFSDSMDRRQHNLAFNIDARVDNKGPKKIYIFSMHSHPKDHPYPPSPTDMSVLLDSRGRNDNVLLPAGIMVVIPKEKFVVFRGPNTPVIPRQELGTMIEGWNSKINTYIRRYGWSRSDANMQVVYDMAGQYDLRVFKCKTGDNIAKIYHTGFD